MNRSKLVLFDFDGTLTHSDSLPHFLWSALPWPRLAVGTLKFALQLVGLLFSGKITAEAAKEALFAAFFKGKTESEMLRLGIDFSEKQLPALLRPEIMAEMRAQKKAGATVAIVSASVDIWLRPFCQQEGLDLLCTELEFSNNIFTGKFANFNCNGPEKARRIRDNYILSSFDEIVAYGNSRGDFAMFSLANDAWLMGKNGKMRRIS